MKILFILMTVFLIQVHATTHAQVVTLTKEHSTIREIFSEIKKQTGYSIIYNSESIKWAESINIEIKNEPLESALKKVLKNQALDFVIKEKEIIIREKPSVAAVQQTINGKITDEAGVPMVGVTVLINGTTTGTTTNMDGHYKILVSPGKTISFKYIGFITQEIVYTNQTEINVVLKEDTTELDEVVLVGYSTNLRKDITGSVSKVNMKAIENSSAVTFDNALIGQAAGVYVVPSSGEPGASAKIRIRGITSVFGNNEPLYVIDGIPFEIGQGLGNDSYSSSYDNSFSPLASINPQDIESIDILKDASATAIYGSRGANGVVIVTTKKGSYSSIPSIKMSAVTSVSNFAQSYDMLSADELSKVVELAYQNAGAALPAPEVLFPFGKDVNTDWEKETDQTAITQN